MDWWQALLVNTSSHAYHADHVPTPTCSPLLTTTYSLSSFPCWQSTSSPVTPADNYEFLPYSFTLTFTYPTHAVQMDTHSDVTGAFSEILQCWNQNHRRTPQTRSFVWWYWHPYTLNLYRWSVYTNNMWFYRAKTPICCEKRAFCFSAIGYILRIATKYLSRNVRMCTVITIHYKLFMWPAVCHVLYRDKHSYIRIVMRGKYHTLMEL